MEFKKYIDYRLLGITGSILLIISEFLPWFSGLNLYDIYVFTTIFRIEDAFFYLFPLMSGIICFIGSGLILYDDEYRLNSVIINFIGLGFLTLFLFEIIPGSTFYLSRVGAGFYFCIAGFLLIFIDILNILLEKEPINRTDTSQEKNMEENSGNNNKIQIEDKLD